MIQRFFGHDNKTNPQEFKEKISKLYKTNANK